MQFTPTVVVGVGQAGINVINQLHDSDGLGWGEEYNKYLDYIAIDSDSHDLWNAPDKATQVDLGDSNAKQPHMQWPKGDKKTDLRDYPYLKEDMEIGALGTRRQRPVGRYKLDNRGMDSWDTCLDKIRGAIENHMRMCRQDPDINARQINVIHVHSLGGGTGSGTFPLIGHMLNQITDNVSGAAGGMDIFTAGVGVVPEVMHNMDRVYPPGDNRYYANTYAALRDLEKIMNASPNDPLPIYLYSKVEEAGGGTMADVGALEPQHELEYPPYPAYFLVGVDEELMAHDDWGPETHRSMVNNTITAAIYGFAAAERLRISWNVGFTRTKTRIGSFDQTQLSVPIEDIRTYCDLNERIESLREQVGRDDGGGTLVDRLRGAQRQRAVLERVVDDSAAALRECEQPVAVDDEIEDALDCTIGSEEDISETTPKEIEQFPDTLTERHGESVGLLALDRAEERLIAAEQRREADLQEVVDDHWTRFGDTEELDDEVNSVSERAEALREYFRGEVERLELELDEDGLWFLPDFDILDFGPDYEQQRDVYQRRLTELEEGWANLEVVRETLQAVRSRRDELLEKRIEPELARVEERIDERREELGRATAELNELIQDREGKVDELTDAEYGSRLGLLALNEEKLREDLDREMLEEDLTSLRAFHEEGYLARDLGEQIEERIGQCFAWDSAVMSRRNDMGMGVANGATGIRDIWMFHSDENANLTEFDITDAGRYQFRRSDDESVFPSFEDPYTIQFLSYAQNSPLIDLQLYQELKRAAEEGRLDAILDAWDDYRLAFAYPEWYGREIEAGFCERPAEVPMLPELDETNVTINKEGGELKAWIGSHGLVSYLWVGDEWDDFDGYITVDGYDHVGWKYYLGEEYGLTYDDMRSVVPSGRTAQLWHAGEITWEKLLEEVQANLIDEHGIEIELTKG